MATLPRPAVREELLTASDETIEDAVMHADPMVLRGLLYQLTADPELLDIDTRTMMVGFVNVSIPASEGDLALLRRKTVEFLKAYRDAGAGEIDIGPHGRLRTSLSLIGGNPIPDSDIGMVLEELALDPWARSLRWRAEPDPERLRTFSVTIIGSGMGGLNAALQLKRAGIAFTLVEKNSGVGGTWYENRYPGARLDSPSRSYTNIFGVDYPYPNPYCAQEQNENYFNWIADTFDLRGDMVFDTEAHSLVWDEKAAMWDIHTSGPDGDRTIRSNAVITSVGFLNRPSMPGIAGMEDFEGPSWHTARWPEGVDLTGKRIAVIGTGCSGYQLIPEIVPDAAHVTVFQRTAQWLFEVRGYRSPFAPQVNWLDRNLPFHTNFMRFRYSYGPDFAKVNTIEPGFDDPDACSPMNKAARDSCVAFLRRKLNGNEELVATMTPPHPVWSARPVRADPEYSVLDAIQADNVTLVTSGIERIDATGIVGRDGVRHDADVIVYATGFHANDYLFPMEITGVGGKTMQQLWADGGPRAYGGCMMPGFPNLWTVYGPNTNGAMTVAAFHEMVALFALQCMERLILEGKRTVEVKEDAYWRYNTELDERNREKVWSDPRAHNYYWSKHGRSAVMNPFTGPEIWALLRHPHFEDLELR